jgi:hypothetical protein
MQGVDDFSFKHNQPKVLRFAIILFPLRKRNTPNKISADTKSKQPNA